MYNKCGSDKCMNKDVIKDIPKVELHLHLDGSVSKERACSFKYF